MKEVFIIELSTGEYSDQRETPMFAVLNEDDAKFHVQQIKEAIIAQGCDEGSKANNSRRPNSEFQYEGESYRVAYTGLSVNYYHVKVRPQ